MTQVTEKFTIMEGMVFFIIPILVPVLPWVSFPISTQS